MRKQSVIILLAAVLTASCSREEPAGGVEAGGRTPLVFQVCAVNSVKGYVTGDRLYDTPEDELYAAVPSSSPRDMYVSAYLYTQNGEEDNHFIGEKFSYDAAKNSWSHDPMYYWPYDSAMDFLVYSSSVPFDAGDVEWRGVNGADRVILTVRGDRTQDDVCYAADNHRTHTSGAVPITFRHTQAWLNFRLRVTVSDTKYTLKSVRLKDVYKAGVVTITNNDGYGKAEWDFRTTVRRDIIVDDTRGILGTDLVTTYSYMDMLVPEQEMKDIELDYTVDDNPVVRTAKFCLPHKYWLAGCKYVYTMDFTPEEIRAAITLEDMGHSEFEVIMEEVLPVGT